MTKKELINNVRLRENMTWDDATRIVNGLIDDMSQAIVGGEGVYIPKFGRLFTTDIQRKRGIHPITKEEFYTPTHVVVRFRMAEGLRRKLETR